MKVKVFLNKLIYIILFFPKIIYVLCIKPIIVYLAKDEINTENKKYKNLLSEYRQVKNELQEKTKSEKILKVKINRFNNIIEHYKDWNTDIKLTKNKEIVFIFSSEKTEFDSYYLCGFDGKHSTNDCRINFQTYGISEMKILDIISETKNKGYAKTLLKYTIKEAKENGIEKIHGELGSPDKSRFEWLIPFYEFMGFTCTLFKDESKTIIGKIEMNLNKK